MQLNENGNILLYWRIQISQYNMQEMQCCEWDHTGYKGPCGRTGEEEEEETAV